MKRSTAKLLSIIGAFLCVGICFLFIPSGNEAAMAITFLIYIPIAIVLLHFQRCKACGRWPRRGDFFDTYCPRCGEPYGD